MDPNLWKLNDRNCSEFAEQVQLTLKNQMADGLTFRLAAEPFDTEECYAYGDALSLYKGDTRWFSGVVTSGRRFGSSSDERHDYEATGLWWYLDNLTFQQEWRVLNGDTLNKSHVILGKNIDDEYISIGAVIAEVLDYAILRGAPFSYAGLAALTAEPPSDEQTDVTCSEVIRKMIRWVPDTVCWFDYAPAVPVLHFARRGAATAIQLPCIGDTEQIDICSREDLVKHGVVINYERIDTIDGEQIPAIEQDFAGDTADAFMTATFTIGIAGLQLATQSVVVTVDEEWNADFTEGAFWKEHVPELADMQDLVITVPGATGVNFPHILLSGTVPAWTNKSAGNKSFFATIGYTDANGSTVEASQYQFDVILTDAETKTYTREISSALADDTPTGLAAMLLGSINAVHWQGRFQLLAEECSGDIHPGNVLDLTGGLAAWDGMRAAIQQVTFDLDMGRTSLQFGPPEYLGLADYISLLNANRTRVTHYSADSRSTGKSSSGADLSTGGGTANNNVSGGAPRFSKIVLVEGSGEEGSEAGRRVVIDTAEEVMKPNMTLVVDEDGKSAGWGFRRLS